MPKSSAYTLAWSSATHSYELCQSHNRVALEIVPESPEWVAWLDQISSLVFL